MKTASVPPDARHIRRLANEQRYQIGPLEKAYRLAALLGEIARDRHLHDRLVLKGGTALHLYHGNLQRLSVDADLNYLGTEAADQLPDAKRHILNSIDRVARFQGYKPRTVKDAHALHSLLLSYDTVNGGTDAIKLDLNFLERVTVLEPQDKAPPEIFALDAPPVPCLHLTELAGSKLATALLRGTARDVFDIATLDWTAVDQGLARKIALFHGFLDHPGLSNLDPGRVDELSHKAWQRDVQNMLRKGSQIRFEAIKRDANTRIQDLFPLEPSEIRCQSLLLRGEWEPGLLFGEASVNLELARHPAMQWRLRNPDARLER